MSIDMSTPITFLKTMRLNHYAIPSDFMLDMQTQVEELEQELAKLKAENEKYKKALRDILNSHIGYALEIAHEALGE